MDLLGEKHKQSLQDTNDIINVFWSFKQPIRADQVQLIKDWNTMLVLESREFAIMFCRAILNAEKTYYLTRYGISKSDCDKIKSSDTPLEVAFDILKVYDGTYNKIHKI